MSRAMHDIRERENAYENVTGIAQCERPLPRRFHTRKLIFCSQFVTIIARRAAIAAFSLTLRDRKDREDRPMTDRKFTLSAWTVLPALPCRCFCLSCTIFLLSRTDASVSLLHRGRTAKRKMETSAGKEISSLRVATD